MDRVFLGDAHDVEGNLSGLDKTRAAESGRDNLVVTTAGTKEISEFTMFATEAARGVSLRERPPSNVWERREDWRFVA